MKTYTVFETLKKYRLGSQLLYMFPFTLILVDYIIRINFDSIGFT